MSTIPLGDPALAEILDILRNLLPDLGADHGVKSLGVFGSYATGEQTVGSDLDLLVEFDQAPTLFEFVRLRRSLAVKLGIKVDLVMKSTLKPHIGKQILKQVVPV